MYIPAVGGCYFAEKSILTAVIPKILRGLPKLLVCMLSKFSTKFCAKSFHRAIEIDHTVVISLMWILLRGGRRHGCYFAAILDTTRAVKTETEPKTEKT